MVVSLPSNAKKPHLQMLLLQLLVATLLCLNVIEGKGKQSQQLLMKWG
jgi:hypothetical protein